MRRTTFITALIACLALAVAIAPAASAKGGGTVRSIALKPSLSFPNASGKAVYKVSGSERELEVDVQGIRALAGKRVNVNVNGHLFATPRVNSLGHFTVTHSTSAGQSVPTIKSGSTVRVRTLGGTLVAGGTF
ncbi:MAG TPA: hypothetical protein VHI30_07535 [Gaiellales bacterium]|jgi:hypothetical protein|nr:hypothetical protein [Gaiellales bacterium]